MIFEKNCTCLIVLAYPAGCDDGIMLPFCPAGQTNFGKSKNANGNNAPATVHGVVFDISAFAGPAWRGTGLVPRRRAKA
ncbi:hypothetical protein [Bradyrhizobium guangxiense]|uniref:hypothetical protein n=1 Tax=Bradyrhizobium guangxiense TaxID=1325115 RepID=UPI001008D061|nr:hypothetical protein [Bradyrhizobium guangxiense]